MDDVGSAATAEVGREGRGGGGGAQQRQLLVNPADGSAVVEEHPRHLLG
jgi:hypothetical protein